MRRDLKDFVLSQLHFHLFKLETIIELEKIIEICKRDQNLLSKSTSKCGDCEARFTS